MSTHTITVELTDNEVRGIQQNPTNPAAEGTARSRAFGKFLDAVLALPEPQPAPQPGDTARYYSRDTTRPVVAVHDGWVYLGESSQGDWPYPVRCEDFHTLFEVVS